MLLTLFIMFQSFLSRVGVSELVSWSVFKIPSVEWIEKWVVKGSPFNFVC